MAQSKIADEQSLECAVCLKELSDPRMLPCSHTFCCQCIENLEQVSWTATTIYCPTCRAGCQVPAGGADCFPRNAFANMCRRLNETLSYLDVNALEIDEDGSSTRCVNWDEGDKHGKATVFCEKCAGYLCRQCQIVHPRQKAFRGHNLVPVDDITPESAVEARARINRPRCEAHGQFLILNCDTCHQPICHECCVVNHKDHTYRELSSVARELKAQLKDAVAPLTKLVSKYEFHLEELRKKESSTNTALREIADSLDTSIGVLQTKASTLKQELISHDTSVKGRFNETKIQLMMLKSKGEALCEKIHRVCTADTEPDIVLANQAPVLLKDIQDVHQTVIYTPEVNVGTSHIHLGAESFSSFGGHVTCEELELPPLLQADMANLKYSCCYDARNINSMTSFQNNLYVICGHYHECKNQRQFQYHTTTTTAQVKIPNRCCKVFDVIQHDQICQCAPFNDNLKEVQICSIADNCVFAFLREDITSLPGHFIDHTRMSMMSTQLDLTTGTPASHKLHCISSLNIVGVVTGITSDQHDNVVITTKQPKQIAVYAIMKMGPKPTLVLSRVVELPRFGDGIKKAVISGENLAVFTQGMPHLNEMNSGNSIVWVDWSGNILHGWPANRADSSSIVDITYVSQEYLLMSDSRNNRICLLDAKGQLLGQLANYQNQLPNTQSQSQQRLGPWQLPFLSPGLLHWDALRGELYMACSLASNTYMYETQRQIQVYKAEKSVPSQQSNQVKVSGLKVKLHLPKIDN